MYDRRQLQGLMNLNVVEMVWTRRHLKDGYAPTRRALGTNNRTLLNSPAGRNILRFDRKGGFPPYDPADYNLVTYWDIFRQGYRNASCESLRVVKLIPLTSADEIRQWWGYFDLFIRRMNKAQRKAFMDN